LLDGDNTNPPGVEAERPNLDEGLTGWVIGRGETYENPEQQDAVESGALYDILEQEVAPLFYERGRDGLPRRWIARMKRSMHLIGSYFNTHRMTADYVRGYYVDAGKRFESLTAEGAARAKAVAAWRQRIRQQWSSVRVEDVKSAVGSALLVGDPIEVIARVRLGDLRPDEVQVQLGVGALAEEDRLEEAEYTRMTADEKPSDGVYTYRCAVPCVHSGRCGFAVRVLPYHPDLVHPFEPGMVVWG